MSIGSRIKTKREEVGISQTELAERIKTSKQNIYKYENGLITNIPSDKIELIAEALQTTPAYLMGWEDITFPESSAGIINIKDELDSLLSRIDSSHTVRYRDSEMDKTAQAMLKNSLEGLNQNLELIVKK